MSTILKVTEPDGTVRNASRAEVTQFIAAIGVDNPLAADLMAEQAAFDAAAAAMRGAVEKAQTKPAPRATARKASPGK